MRIKNIVSDFGIQNGLATEHKKVKRIDDQFQIELQEAGSVIKIYFISAGSTDARMKFFRNEARPMLIPDKDSGEGLNELEEQYRTEVFRKDLGLLRSGVITSEISVPILYRGTIPFGYVRINSPHSYDETILRVIKDTATQISNLSVRQNVIPISNANFSGIDLTNTTLTIEFADVRLIRNFKEHTLVNFDLELPGNKAANILAEVQHINRIEGHIVHAACTIKQIDPLGQLNYEEFIESMGERLSEVPTGEVAAPMQAPPLEIESVPVAVSQSAPTVSTMYYDGLNSVAQGDNDKALALFKQVLSVQNLSSETELKFLEQAQFQLALAYMRKKEYSQSIQEFSLFSKKHPRSEQLKKAYLNCAQIYEKHRNLAKAAQLYAKVSNMQPPDKDSSIAKKKLAELQTKLKP